ncbi:beta-porphyranase A-like [Haliotis rufescens]|uniref:beta-porphyranase A-like n=1 Tax=Haliotis rufescens TaxID=6454 RepID=UPI00201F9412|nr:beta-porphyranase A-like [Haliotis rufescens]
MQMVPVVALLSVLLCGEVLSDTKFTIYNEWHSQGGRVHYEVDRWNKHNGFDQPRLIPKCKAYGTVAGRWINSDLYLNLFHNWHQDPNHHGYPDPHYIQDRSLQQKEFGFYEDQIRGYGKDVNNLVWEMRGLSWPNWIDTSHHQGKFPNNVDAAAEFVSLMVQGTKDFTGGHLPAFFEVINEPDASYKFLDSTTVINFHKAVAQKLKSRFGMKVGGPTYTGYFARADDHNFSFWKGAAKFLDMSLDHMDFFSFHAYNDIHVSGGSHSFSGINEARLVAVIDMIENYSHIKKGKNFPIIVSEFGRGGVHGISQDAHSGIVDFGTLYLSNAQMFTYLNLREFMERVVVFLLSNEQYPGHNSLNWSMFTRDGRELPIANFFKFWHNLYYDQKFLKVSSDYTGWERQVAPLALANPNNKEMMVLLHNYGKQWQNVKLDFHNGWINPTTGESTCIQYQNGNAAMHSNVHFDTNKNNGHIGLPGESSCIYKFKTNYNFGGLRTNNENTHFGKDMIIPINNGHAQTTIQVQGSGFHTARLRVGVSRSNGATGKPQSVTINGNKLQSTFMLYDSDKNNAPTKWEMWEYLVPTNVVHSSNTVSMSFAGNGGHVSSVALIVGNLQ